MADWSTLPPELLHLISQKLPTAIDHLRFRSVCLSWRASLPPPPSPTRFPILPNSGISDTSWGFHLSKRTVYSIHSPSSYQSPWIIKIERDHPSRMHLLNPLSRSRFKPLPHNFPNFFNFSNLRVKELGQEYALQYINFRPMANSIGEAGNLYMEKVAVLDDSADGFVLLTIHVSGKLVVYKSGDEKWRVIDYLPSPYDDVILRKGTFYAVDNTGRIVSVDCVNLSVNIVADSIFGGDKKFLVESNHELLLVDMFLSVGPADDLGYDEGFEFYEEFDCFMSERTVKFKVFRLDEGVGWVEMNDLGDEMLFLGDNCTFSASAAEVLPDGTCGGNCIFFTDQYCGREDDGAWKSCGVGMFDLGSGHIGSLGSHQGYSNMFWPPPEWVFPIASIQELFQILTLKGIPSIQPEIEHVIRLSEFGLVGVMRPFIKHRHPSCHRMGEPNLVLKSDEHGNRMNPKGTQQYLLVNWQQPIGNQNRHFAVLCLAASSACNTWLILAIKLKAVCIQHSSFLQ